MERIEKNIFEDIWQQQALLSQEAPSFSLFLSSSSHE